MDPSTFRRLERLKWAEWTARLISAIVLVYLIVLPGSDPCDRCLFVDVDVTKWVGAMAFQLSIVAYFILDARRKAIKRQYEADLPITSK